MLCAESTVPARRGVVVWHTSDLHGGRDAQHGAGPQLTVSYAMGTELCATPQKLAARLGSPSGWDPVDNGA
jgi:hypothetical protein